MPLVDLASGCAREGSLLLFFFFAAVAVSYKTQPTACRAPLFIVRTLFNNTIAITVWTSFHTSLHSLHKLRALNGCASMRRADAREPTDNTDQKQKPRRVLQCTIKNSSPNPPRPPEFTAGAFGFLIFIQCGERPDRYGGWLEGRSRAAINCSAR